MIRPISRARTPRRRVLAAMAALIVFVACDDSPTSILPTDTTVTGSGGLLSGRVDPTSGTFTLPSGTESAPGAFLLRGSNVAFDGDLGALVVDLTLTNRSTKTYAEPVMLTFLNVLPAGVTVLNADNAETGPGAAFDVSFANDDGMWTEGEESLPFTVQFGMDAPAGLGFVSRVDVGMSSEGGHISGVVWHDADEDGMIGIEESGIGDAGILLRRNGDVLSDTRTAEDGTYRFDGLEAGLYSVEKRPSDDVEPTTPTTISVLLVDTKGGVSSFEMANFGCIPLTDDDDVIEVGDVITAVGHYDAEAGGLLAREIDEGDDDGEWAKPKLVGPITDLVAKEGALSIMGVGVAFGEDADVLPGGANDCGEKIADLEVGMRVYARLGHEVPEEDETPLVGRALRCWNGEPDKVRGRVTEILEEEGVVVAYRVNRLLVFVNGHGDEHDDDGEDDGEGDG